ncbi:hypothetical protein COK05_13575 [Bacillus cereus]|uniref:Uncharacterized protein n=1 Tax=Bacillus cereus TaxID=1396 RepID=A0A2B2LTX5_BACCE|nr:hypothetical protein COK05_13575 [Bacillus cereus]PGU00316.1 hypothetical protein COD21_30775 [Bacillus cereus]
MKLKSMLCSLLIIIAVLVGDTLDIIDLENISRSGKNGASKALYLLSDRFSETAWHIKGASVQYIAL